MLTNKQPLLWQKLGTLFLLAGLGLLVILSAPYALAAGTTRYVHPTGTDTGNCTESNCASVSYALSQSAAGDEIKVAPGIYTDSITFDRHITIQGGSAATTIIQANAAPNVAATRVFTVHGGIVVTMTGVSIRHGQAVGSADPGRGGGGWVAGRLTMIDAVVGPNKATSGGGLAVNNVNGLVVLSNTHILSNTAVQNGGGIYLYTGAVELRGGQVMSNAAINSTAGNGGGIYLFGAASAVTQTGATLIAYNQANGGSGGGIFIDSGRVTMNSAAIMSNTASSSSYGGGGARVDGLNGAAQFTLVNGLLQANTASGDFSAGGAVNVSSLKASAALTLTRIFSNQAAYGSGVYVNDGQATIADSLFLHNTAVVTAGAVLLSGSGHLTVSNSCIVGNSDLAAVRDNTSVPTLVATNNWWGAADGPAGVGPGAGDSVSAAVDYQPFRTSPASICFYPTATTHLPLVLKD